MIVLGLILIGLAAVMALADSGQARQAHADAGTPACPRRPFRSMVGVALVAASLLN